MHRKTLFASVLAVALAGSTSFVMAQNTPPPAPPTSTHQAMAGHDMHAAHAGWSHAMHMHHDGQRGGVIGDLHQLERLYMQAGRSKDLAAVYNEVLAKSQDPRVRDYAYQHLAHLQAQPANLDQAINTMHKALDESLASEAKMRAMREQMRTNWRQKHDDKAAPATK